MAPSTPRDLHPLAWWAWAIGVAVAASTTTNPVVLGGLFCAVWLVVSARRGSSPWSRAFRLYVVLGVVIVLSRLFFHVLVGFKYGEHVLLRLPSVPLPGWAAGIQLGGTVYAEGLLSALALGLRLAVLVIAIGAANALANPKRLLRSMPRALHEVGTALVVSVSVAPQLAESVQRVMRARHLRGETGRGIRAVPRVALPVLQDTLDRSLLLASAMESRGYGSLRDVRRPRWVPVLTLGGMLVVCFGLFEVLDLSAGVSRAEQVRGWSILAAGVALLATGIVLSGTTLRVSTYRPDPWREAESMTLVCGAGCAALMLRARNVDLLAMDLQTQPLAAPGLPLLALLGVLLAALPAFVTPPPAVVPRGRR